MGFVAECALDTDSLDVCSLRVLSVPGRHKRVGPRRTLCIFFGSSAGAWSVVVARISWVQSPAGMSKSLSALYTRTLYTGYVVKGATIEQLSIQDRNQVCTCRHRERPPIPEILIPTTYQETVLQATLRIGEFEVGCASRTQPLTPSSVSSLNRLHHPSVRSSRNSLSSACPQTHRFALAYVR